MSGRKERSITDFKARIKHFALSKMALMENPSFNSKRKSFWKKARKKKPGQHEVSENLRESKYTQSHKNIKSCPKYNAEPCSVCLGFLISTKSTACYHEGCVENWAVSYKLENIWTPLPNQPKLASK